MSKKKILSCGLVLILLLTIAVNAQFYESFNNSVGGNIVSPGLNYPSLNVGGNAARSSAIEFLFQNAFPSTVGSSVRISVLMKPESNSFPWSKAFFRVNSEDKVRGAFSFGKYMAEQSNTDKWAVEINGTRHYANKKAVAGNTYYLVVQIDYKAGAERIRLWVNPAAMNNLGSADILANADVDVSNINFKGLTMLGWENNMPSPDYTFDELRVEKFVPIPCAASPNNSTAWFAFDETSGNTAKNLVTGGSNGTYFNNPASATGKVGNARTFDGTDDYVDVPSSNLNFGTGDFSIYSWVKIPSGASSLMTIADKRDNSSAVKGYSFYVSNGQLGLQLANGIPTPKTFTNYNASNTSIADGNWHHVGVTVKRNLNGIKWYVDGVQQGSANPILRSGNLNTNSPLRIGNTSFTPNSFFKGVIDEFEIFNRVISGAEIKGVFDAQSSGKCQSN